MATLVDETPDRLVFRAHHWVTGLFFAAVGAGILVAAAAEGPAATAIGLATLALGVHLGAGRAEAVVDATTRTVRVRRPVLGIPLRTETIPFASVQAVGVLRDVDDGLVLWAVALDCDGAFPLAAHARTTWGPTTLPFVPCRINGHPLWFLDVDEDARVIEAAVERLQRLLGCPVRGDVAADGPPWLAPR